MQYDSNGPDGCRMRPDRSAVTWTDPITPSRARKLRKLALCTEIEYHDARRSYLAARPERNAMPYGLGVLAREDGVGVVLDARRWMYEARRMLAGGLARGVVLGAAWSPAALMRVRGCR